MATGTTNIGFEEKLWQAEDKLRSNMDAEEYKHVVLVKDRIQVLYLLNILYL
ncbi:MAG: SAM-dependent DNA methyltransferase [Lachnospiraceae bacterium]|nr:SAM-dependent DNA methyltransferase [Lachnospiraceae bacterium]